MIRPNFFIVGAPKSGTSAMYTYLRQHPQVYMSRQKELHFFGSDLHHINHVPFTVEQYLSFFTAAGGADVVGEASTSYLQSRCAAQEIKTFAPGARILIMLRNPVDAMHAYHATHVYSGFEAITDFQAALAAEADRQRGERWPPARPGIVELLFYRDVVRYSAQVERYFSVFGRERVRVILYDDVQRDTHRAYREVLGFLGVSPDFTPAFRVVNANRRLRSDSLQRFLRHPPQLVQRVLHAAVPESVRRRLVERMTLLNTKHEARRPLPSAVRRELLTELQPDIERLASLIERDLSHWLRDDPRSVQHQGIPKAHPTEGAEPPS